MALGALALSGAAAMPLARPPAKDRTFASSSIDNLIHELYPMFNNEDIAALFYNCFPNTLDTTVRYFTPAADLAETDSFIITGDIEALWLRDSANQVMPYMPYLRQDDKLRSLVAGLINRQARSILIDPFANAFNYNASGAGHQDDQREPPMGPAVFEGKYEIDSLCAFLKLSYWYWFYSSVGKSHPNAQPLGTGDDSHDLFSNPQWLSAVNTSLDAIAIMQTETGYSSELPYTFARTTSEALDTLIMGGRGPPGKPCGLSRSLFRPSDDATTMAFNVPGNAMAAVELGHLLTILNDLIDNAAIQIALKEDINALVKKVANIRTQIEKALTSLTAQSNGGESCTMYPYECDGNNGRLYMDDANMPSLLSLPLLGFASRESQGYKSTREFVLSRDNPYWYSGAQGEGVGGPHVSYNHAWPMSIVIRAMTSTDDDEVARCLQMLSASSVETGFMHESFNVNNMTDFTRPWFAWANGMFAELLLQLVVDRPHLVIKPEDIARAQALVSVPVSLQVQRDIDQGG